ncbi:MAG: lysylphosphatidylglycerol synthase transmembrane domain-containing protein [Planctomycetota bacterium]
MAESKSTKSKHIFLALRVGLVVTGIVLGICWVSAEGRWDKLKDIFLQLNPWVFAAALAIFALGQTITGFRWWLLLRTQSIHIPLLAAIRLYFLGWFYNNVMPSSLGGDLIRAWYVTRHTEKKLEAVLSVFVDRIIGLLSTFVIAAFFYLTFLRGQDLEITASNADGLLSAVGEYKAVLLWVVLGVTGVFAVLVILPMTRAALKKVWAGVYQRVVKMAVKFKNAMVIYCTRPFVLLAVFALTVFIQVSSITGFWLIGSGLGIEAALRYYYVIFTLTWVLGAAPVSIGGAVLVEGLLAYMFVKIAGAGAEAALALALCQRLVWLICSVPGAIIHLAGAHLPKDFSIDGEESMQ